MSPGILGRCFSAQNGVRCRLATGHKGPCDLSTAAPWAHPSPAPKSDPFPAEEAPTKRKQDEFERGQRLAIMSKLLRTCDALPLGDVTMLLSLALHFRPEART